MTYRRYTVLDPFYANIEKDGRADLAEVVANIRDREGDHEGAERMRFNATLMRRDPDGAPSR